jgi:LysM repeat protein
MSKRSSVTARIVAVVALVCGVAILLFVVGSSLNDKGDSEHHSKKGQVVQGEKKGANGKAPSAYVVQNGDTLTSIAHETGVPVSQILELNPGVDPQILISGEKLKLR